MKKYITILAVTLIIACDGNTPSTTDRWYSQAQIDNGATIFKSHCASCHGNEAQGLTKEWRKPLADGSYPAPPLNGSAHAWHHPLKALKRTIREGGIPLGGKMPSFKDKLNDKEIESVLAFIQNKWSNKIYSAWKERGGLN